MIAGDALCTLSRRHHRRTSRPFRAAPAQAQTQAQNWPGKQITIVVPFGAGGSADLLARILATHMQAKFGQTVVVENRAGAGGSIGTNYVAKAAPDGYTLLLGTVSSIAVNAALYAKLPFNVDKDLQPITQLVSFPNLLIVNPNLPIKNVQELIDYVKKHEGKVNYASSGLGTSSHLSVVMFEQAIGAKMTHVPYKSTGDVVNSMLGGNVDIAIDSMTTSGRTPSRALYARSASRRRSAAPRRPMCRRSARPSRASRPPPGRACSHRPARRGRSSRRSRRRQSASGICRR